MRSAIFCGIYRWVLCPLQIIGPLLEPQAEIQLEESCVQFKVEVRCRRLNGSGYWSDWSMSYTSVVYNRKGNIINIVFGYIYEIENMFRATIVLRYGCRLSK